MIGGLFLNPALTLNVMCMTALNVLVFNNNELVSSSVCFSVGLNLVAFLIIVLSYGSMFYNIQRTGTQTTKYSNHIKKELTVAKRFFSIVITDSLCWIPIFILKILSLMEVEIPGKCFLSGSVYLRV